MLIPSTVTTLIAAMTSITLVDGAFGCPGTLYGAMLD